MDQKIIKSNGQLTVVSEKLIEVPEEFRMNTIDVSVETREYILSQSKDQGSTDQTQLVLDRAVRSWSGPSKIRNLGPDGPDSGPGPVEYLKISDRGRSMNPW